MICKWCGAQLAPGKRQCGRCGNEVSPLSDCGGFYDLVPQAAPEIPVAEVAPPKAKANAFLVVLCLLLAAALVVSILSCASARAENRELTEELEEMEERLEERDEEELPNIPTKDQPAGTEPLPTEPLPTEEPVAEDATETEA